MEFRDGVARCGRRPHNHTRRQSHFLCFEHRDRSDERSRSRDFQLEHVCPSRRIACHEYNYYRSHPSPGRRDSGGDCLGCRSDPIERQRRDECAHRAGTRRNGFRHAVSDSRSGLCDSSCNGHSSEPGNSHRDRRSERNSLGNRDQNSARNS